ncbi:hypothetical protein CFP56_011571 [Quercus suber]|uniref:Uncharacterized protein n=1 Tax=Quercus suber TaxID=58331 RepID=A0AAW0M780_QUESU
MENQHQIPSTR